MEYTLSQILKDVRKCLDENEVSTSLIAEGDTDTLSLNTIIKQKIEESARLLQSLSPRKYLDGGVVFPDTTIHWFISTGNGAGYIPLPSDWQRLAVFRMSDWNISCFDTISDDSVAYAMQKSRYLGIKGNPDRPVCAVTVNADGRVMEFYSCTGGVKVAIDKAKYYPLPLFSNDTIRICENLYIPTVTYAAGLTAITVKDEQHGGTLIQNALNEIK
jgi:hypothetical protein